MKLYFSPLACSLASRIVLYEVGAAVTFEEVDAKTKRTASGLDFTAIHPLGLVPVLELDDGAILSENAAILQLLAERFPDAALAPRDPLGRARLQQWLSFIGTELHKALFVPLLDATASKEARAYALSKADGKLAWLASALEGRATLLDEFSVADAYLWTVLNWAMVTPVDLKKHPSIVAYQKGLRDRPSVARAFSEERVLYAKELARNAARGAMNALFGSSPT